MPPKLSFLDLPPEIRHAIYLDYVTVEKGYAFNFETGKLGALGSDGLIKPIHHALKFTCKTVAEEMMGLDFRVNTVNFSTGYSDRWRLSAAQFHHVQSYFSYASLSMLQRKPSNPEDDDADGDSDGDGDQRDGRESQDEGSDQDERREQDVGTGQDGDVHREINNDQIQDQGQGQDHDHDHDHDHDQHQDDDEHDDDDQDGNVDQGEDENEDENQAEQIFLTPCCTRAVVEEVAQRYPDFKPILEVALLGGDVTSDGSHFGLLPTFKRQAVLYTLELAIQHGTIPEDWYEHIFHSPRQLLALQKRFPPWLCCLPLYEIMDVTRHAPSTTFTKKLYPEYWEKPHLDGLGVRQYTQGKYRFSAAALAIRFLSRLPAHLRIHLRDIRLHEDSVSVAFPETHAQGLIKFCIENPKLHIERRLDLWRNVFQSPPNDEISLFTSALEDRWVTDTTDGERGPGLWSLVLTDKVALWIMEALALLPLGMPKESFTLVLDGGEAPGKCSEIFQQIVQRDAAWQAAWEIVAATEFSDHNYLTKRVHHCYRIDGFPEAMRDLENDPHGFIQCTFDLRPSIWHVEKETEKFRHLTVEQSHALPIDNQMFFQPPEPLPSWRDLLAENILPEFFGEQEIVKSEHNWEYLLDETDDDEEDNDEEDRWTEEIHEKFSTFMVKKENEEVERLAQGFAFFNLWDGYDSVFED